MSPIVAAVHNLLTMRASDEEFHCLRHETWCRTLAILSFRVYYWLYKDFERFLWSVLNDSFYFCKPEPQMQKGQQ